MSKLFENLKPICKPERLLNLKSKIIGVDGEKWLESFIKPPLSVSSYMLDQIITYFLERISVLLNQSKFHKNQKSFWFFREELMLWVLSPAQQKKQT